MEESLELIQRQQNHILKLKKKHKRTECEYGDKLRTAALANQDLRDEIEALKVMSFPFVTTHHPI